MGTDRWYVKKEGDARVYALTERLGDAELLAARLTRSTGDSFYAMPKPAPASSTHPLDSKWERGVGK